MSKEIMTMPKLIAKAKTMNDRPKEYAIVSLTACYRSCYSLEDITFAVDQARAEQTAKTAATQAEKELRLNWYTVIFKDMTGLGDVLAASVEEAAVNAMYKRIRENKEWQVHRIVDRAGNKYSLSLNALPVLTKS